MNKWIILVIIFNLIFVRPARSDQYFHLQNIEKITINENIEYIAFISVTDNLIFIQIKNLKIPDSIEKEKVVKLNENLFYISRKNNLYFSYNWNETIFKNKISFFENNQNASYLIRKLFLPEAFGIGADSCLHQSINTEIKGLNLQLKRFSIEKTLQKCNFSLENLIEKKIKELKQSYNAVRNLTVSQFIGSIKEAIKYLHDLMPQIHDKLLAPLSELHRKVPPVAEKIVCDFTEAKVGDVFQAVALGGFGVTRLVTKTALEIEEITKKVYLLTKNGVVTNHTTELHSRGLLKSDIIDRIMRLKSDISDDAKRNLKNKLYGFKDHDKMRTHIDKHKKEFGFKSDDEYLNAAHRFAKTVDKDNVAFESQSGDLFKWNTKTDEVVILDKNGYIKTYYKIECKNQSDKLLKLVYEGRLEESTICK